MQASLFKTENNQTTKTFPMLYRIDTKGKMRSWQIGVVPAGFGFLGFSVITTAGLVDGQKVKTVYQVAEGKNIGRSNETSPFEQACFEAKSKWDAQIRSGYVENPANAKQDILGSGIPAPMLAQKYSPDGKLSGSKSLEKMKIAPDQFIHVQPKFDGNRCLIKVNADVVELYTRKGDRVLPIPHIEQQIRKAFDTNCLPENEYILDGELYTNAFSFNTLNGLIRREEKNAEHYEMLEKVDYHLYDLVCNQCYQNRYEIISNYFANAENIKLVPSYPINPTDANIRRMMEQFLNEGYEGLMIRRLDMPYENKRSWGLCKYKDFQDAEYKVVDIIEDVRGGIIGAFECEIFVDGNRQTFRAGIKDLTQDESRKILENKESYIGRMATVEFFSLSEYGIPRFGKLKGFRSDV